MTARIGLGLLVAALVALGGWLAVGAMAAPGMQGTAGVGASSAGSGTSADAAAGTGIRLAPSEAAAPEAAAGSAASGAGEAGAGESGAGEAAAVQAAPESAASGAGDPTRTPSARAAVDAVDAAWATGVARATGIPERAVVAYAGAALALQQEQPSCALGWNTVAALGFVESGHGTHGGATLDAAGRAVPAIVGPALDGGAYDGIHDSDAGAYDGDAVWDHAVGPLQFIPETWARWGADGSGDGAADPQQIDDAALTAARYLCHYGSLADAAGWRAAVFAYNHVDSYVDLVAETANLYATRAASVPVPVPAATAAEPTLEDPGA